MEAPGVSNAEAVSHCPVDADGVEAEWVEAAVASPGQATIVHMVDSALNSLETARPLAGRLAVMTGARVLTVLCPTISDGVTAYAWLLDEGLDLETTYFRAARPDDDLTGAVKRSAQRLGLPLPEEGKQLQVRSRYGCPFVAQTTRAHNSVSILQGSSPSSRPSKKR
jgi:hypothetical protein